MLLRLRLAPATGTANSAELARRRLPAEFPQSPANGRTRHPRDRGDKPYPAAPKASRLGRRQQPPAPLVKIRSQSLVSIFDTIRVVHSLYIEDIPILRNPPSNHPPDHSVISTKLAGIIPSSAQAPGARGGLATPGRRGRTGGLRQDRSNFHVHPHKEKGGIVPVRPFFRPLPTAPNTAPGRPFDCRFRRNATVAHASAVVTPQAGRTDSECHPCKELRPPGSRETLNQELDNFRFDSSWTGPECNVRAPGGGVWRPCTRMTCSLLEPGAVVAEERVERMAGCAGVRRYPVLARVAVQVPPGGRSATSDSPLCSGAGWRHNLRWLATVNPCRVSQAIPGCRKDVVVEALCDMQNIVGAAPNSAFALAIRKSKLRLSGLYEPMSRRSRWNARGPRGACLLPGSYYGRSS